MTRSQWLGWVFALLTAACSANSGDSIDVDAGAANDTPATAHHDARATDSSASSHTDSATNPGHDAVATHIDAGHDSAIPPGMDSAVPPGMDSGVTPVDAGVVAMDVTPWTPPDVPALDVLGATLDASTTPMDSVFTLAGATAATASLFGGSPSASRAPSIVYPSAGVIVPPNLPSFEVHFMPGAGNTQFAIAFSGDDGTVTFYTGCTPVGGGCVAAFTTAQFNEVARVAQPGGDVTLSLRGTDASGGSYGSAPTQTLGVTATVLHGGLYYWAAASGNILRYDWDLPGASPEVYLTGNPLLCVGCHVLGRDGRRAAVGRFIPGPAQMTTFDVASRATLSATFGGNFASFSPDDLRLLVSDGAHLWVADSATGATAPGLPGGTVGSMPDWAPDGRHAVYSQPMSVPFLGGTPGHNAPANLMLLTWAVTAFGAPAPLVTASVENNYYPSFSPDNAWVLFNRSGSTSYDATDAALWVVPSDRSRAPIALSAANTAGVVGNSWPKFAPFAQLYQGQLLLWFTFSSRRNYGLRLVQPSDPTMQTEQLWMAAFRPGMATSGDPSAPAFWLPMQDLTTGNHIGQWSQAVLRAGCTTNADCMTTEHCQATNAGMACVGITN